jgi:glyoxylase-like metal-dependent hydrolase (beta-lactamase superfamily II)
MSHSPVQHLLRVFHCATLTLVLLSATAPIAPARAQSASAGGAWNSGAPNEPVLRVRRVAPHFWAIRQGKRSNAEAPFMYLIAGRDSALLLDTGAAPTDSAPLPLVAVVDSLLRTLPSGHSLPLLVLHSHGHSDHRFLDATFAQRANTRVVHADTAALMSTFGMARWPHDSAVINLGGRPLHIIPAPGHQSAHIMVYDAQTGTLLSGDMLYPGLLTVRDLPAFRASAQRVLRFTETHAIWQILGAHVEMTSTPGRMYPLGTVSQPHEHALGLSNTAVRTLVDALAEAGDFVRELPRSDFILGRVQPPSTDRPSTHGMLMFGSERVFLSHLPMSRAPHNYQLVFEAGLSDSVQQLYRRDVAQHPTEIYTLEPAATWVLPNTIIRDTVFPAHLYRGHFERGGTRIATSVPITVRKLVMFRRFESQDSVRASAWFTVGSRSEKFLVHRIAGLGDVDQVAQLCPRARDSDDGQRIVLKNGATLQVGALTPAGRVCRVLYTEREDLAH